MNRVASGSHEASLAVSMGHSTWSRLERYWRKPEAVFEPPPGPGCELFWLYQCPARVLLDGPADQEPQSVLDEWVRTNREALNLRARLAGGKLHFVDADQVDADSLVMALDAGGSPVGKALHPDASRAGALRRALEVLYPEVTEIWEYLRACAVTGDECSAAATADRGDVLQTMVAVLRREQAGAAQLESLNRESESLKGVARELDEERRAARSLMAQLHQVQEELEAHFLASSKLTAELESSRADRVALEDELRALRAQLSYMQAELAARPIASTASPAASVPRRLARLVLRRRRTASDDRELVADTLRRSTWFDPDWYLGQYRDVAESGMDPVIHYLDHGASEGRDPGPGFSTSYYLEVNRDVADAGMNPLHHFLLHGLAEGRAPRKL